MVMVLKSLLPFSKKPFYPLFKAEILSLKLNQEPVKPLLSQLELSS